MKWAYLMEYLYNDREQFMEAINLAVFKTGLANSGMFEE